MRRFALTAIIIFASTAISVLSQTPSPTAVDPRIRVISAAYDEAYELLLKGDAISLLSSAQKFIEAAELARAIGDDAYAARSLVNGSIAYSKIGDRNSAIKLLTTAYDITPASEIVLKADILQNIGLAFNNIGEHGKAMASFYEEVKLRKSQDDRQGQVAALHNIAMILNELGDMQQAKEIYEDILKIERSSSDKRILAASVNNLAYVYWKLNDFTKAAAYYQEAYQIGLDNDIIDVQSASQIGLGDSYQKLGKSEKALEHYQRGLELSRLARELSFEADALYGLGTVYQSLGQKQRALEFYDHALRLQEALDAREQLSLTLAAEMSLWMELGQPPVAILYGKRAVNVNQALREGLGNLDKGLQKLYVKSKEATYRDLSNILISEGRLPEAQAVLDLLKEQEYEQLTKVRSGETADTVPYSKAESDLVQKIDSLASLTHRQAELEQTRAEKGKLTDQEQAELKTVLADVEAANRAFRLSLDALRKSESSVSEKIGEIEADKNLQRALASLRKELNTGLVAIYTVIGTGVSDGSASHAKFGWAVLVTPEGRKAYPIDVKNLEENVQLFRTALRSPAYDPRPVAQKLYDAIFRQTSPKQKTTLEKDLNEVFRTYKDKTIMWSLDGVLRYVPMSALFDGKNYLVEKYRSSVFTKQSLLLLTEKDNAEWETLGLGVSEKKVIGDQSFSALDGAKRELKDIVREQDEKTGIFEGTRKLNSEFTKDGTIELLREGKYHAVHIASHFSFNPTDQASSFLVIGDGKLTFADLQDKDNLLESVDLLTLSACDTAMASNGKESEGFPFLAQSLGAKTVIASLWKVSDKGTPELMIRFYRLRADNPSMPKGEAFRQAQLSLLNGTARDAKAAGNGRRSDAISLDDTEPRLTRFTADPAKPFAHPHYWASFVLIGNWR